MAKRIAPSFFDELDKEISNFNVPHTAPEEIDQAELTERLKMIALWAYDRGRGKGPDARRHKPRLTGEEFRETVTSIGDRLYFDTAQAIEFTRSGADVELRKSLQKTAKGVAASVVKAAARADIYRQLDRSGLYEGFLTEGIAAYRVKIEKDGNRARRLALVRQFEGMVLAAL